MNFKNPKAKGLIALALALFMVMPMLAVNVAHASGTYPGSGTAPYLDIVPTGGATSTSITDISPLAVGTQFTVDIRVDNYADVNLGGTNNGVGGCSYDVTWNPAVLTFVSNNDPGWLPKETDVDVSSSVASGQFTVNQIAFGSSKQDVASSPTGSVSEQITFQVASAGTSNIQIQPSGAGVAYLQAPTSTSVSASSGPVPGTLTYGAIYNPVTEVSLLQAPNDNSNQITYTAGTDPIGQTFQVDIYLNNPLAIPIFGYNLGVTWNPAAIQLETITEGSYMKDAIPSPNPNSISTLFAPGAIDNNAGDIPQGISDVYIGSSYFTTTSASGVLATLTFEVMSYASSSITLVQNQGQIQSLVTLNANDQAVALTTAPILNNAQYTTIAPPADVAPTAVITNQNPQSVYIQGQTIPLVSTGSTGGQDAFANPFNPNIPISSYTWSISPSISGVTPSTTSSWTFTAPLVSTLTTYTITLVVNAVPVSPQTSDGSYQSSSTPVPIQVNVQPPSIGSNGAGAAVDVFTYQSTPVSTTNPQKAAYGYGPNAFSDAYGPQEYMNLAAFVSYNGGSVADKPVTFVVKDGSGNVIATLYGETGPEGYATTTYQLPWTASTTGADFGIWTVTAQSVVGNTTCTDVMPFDYNYVCSITGVTVDGQTSGSDVARTPTNGASLALSTTANIAVSLQNIADQSEKVWITYTIMDSYNVPVATGIESTTINAATYTSGAPTSPSLTVTPTAGSVSFTPTIPSYAFIGTATVYVNIYNQDPTQASNNAVSLAPQATATFQIVMESGSNPAPGNGLTGGQSPP